MHAADRRLAEMRFEREKRLAVEGGEGNAQRARLLGVRQSAILSARRPEGFDPTALAEQGCSARRRRQGAMLGDRVSDQSA